MEKLMYQDFSAEYTADGEQLSYVYRGTRSEMEELASEHRVGEAEEAGRLKMLRISPHEGPVWKCELQYEAANDWQSVAAPDRSWGKRSCQLRGSMRSRPLAAHPRYRANWDHFLASCGNTALPAWWESAANTAVPDSDAETYRWCKAPGELPSTASWRILRTPSKPGVTSFTSAAYSITETARFRSAQSAGNMVSSVLNRIGAPSSTFGIRGGNWKCDDAAVAWNGSFWLARLTWTHCAESWDDDLYGTGSEDR